MCSTADLSYNKTVWLDKAFGKRAGPFNINVNAVAPGFIDTEMIKGFTHFIAETVALRRIGTTKDVVDVVEFLVSEKSSYITVATIDIKGVSIWVETLEKQVSGCCNDKMRKFFHDNAVKFYRLF
ncbi:MAG: SDR family oxidoreductase [Candidatus Humimicrobiaceae bacterium]